jgi:hypothetical protein
MTNRNANEIAAMNLRMATMQMTGLRVPPRIRTIPPLRRRLALTVTPEPPQTVIIRHTVQNMDTNVNETRPIQNQRV